MENPCACSCAVVLCIERVRRGMMSTSRAVVSSFSSLWLSDRYSLHTPVVETIGLVCIILKYTVKLDVSYQVEPRLVR